MTEPQQEQTTQLTIADLHQKLIEISLSRGDQMLKTLNERKEQVTKSSPENIAALEKQLVELEEAVLAPLPESAKKTLEEKVISTKNTLTFIKNTTPETLDRNIEELQKRVNFIKVFGI